MSFGKKLKTLRFTNQLDQNAMSKRLSVSQPVYSRYENDEKQVNENDEFVKRVAKEFGINIKSLVAEDDDTTNFETTAVAKTENYYNLPKDFMDAYFKQQQQMLEQILNVFGKK
jgi:transcriptional regulator with XRE-family HTH domain